MTAGKCCLSSSSFLLVFIVIQAHIISLAIGQTAESSASCGGYFVSEYGVISTPNYPSQYPPFQQCTWVITVPEHNLVKLKFRSFQLEISDTCKYDYLEVHDGPSSGSNLLGKFCGENIPDPIQSTGNTITLYFRTDILDHFTGFSAEFTKVTVCGGNITSERGILLSPNYPNNYGPNERCSWYITVPENYQVILRFQSFQLERGNNCEYDYLEVRDGHDLTSPILGKFCDTNVTEAIRSSENRMTVTFRSDDTREYKGFVAEFTKGLPSSAESSLRQNLPNGLIVGIIMCVITLVFV